MASLERLASTIYHEKQASGSMLCAQHALNSLLQGAYFTAPDLAAIAHGIDHLEQSFDEDRRGKGSDNMDDTGFFSIHVLEKALNVWGLSPVRWRSESMRPFHDQPDSQQAFILNQQQHWYTVRRFGANPGHWYNLNSTLHAPEWVGRLYLGMFLEQAEREGYSVFTIKSSENEADPNPLPPCDADEVASTLPDPSTFGAVYDPSNPSTKDNRASGSRPGVVEGFEDEDLELQAALQASLTDGSSADLVLPPVHSRPFPSFRPVLSTSTSGDANDPVAASLARNRAMLARMQAEQAQALREGYEEEAARVDALGRAHQMEAARSRQTGADGEDDEDEFENLVDPDHEDAFFERDLRHLIPQSMSGDDMGQDGDTPWDQLHHFPPPIPRLTTRPARPISPLDMDVDHDAELAAAIKASLEEAGMDVPENLQGPSTSACANQPATLPITSDAKEPQEPASKDEEGEEVSVDEMRRRRLAKFGG